MPIGRAQFSIDEADDIRFWWSINEWPWRFSPHEWVYNMAHKLTHYWQLMSMLEIFNPLHHAPSPVGGHIIILLFLLNATQFMGSAYVYGRHLWRDRNSLQCGLWIMMCNSLHQHQLWCSYFVVGTNYHDGVRWQPVMFCPVDFLFGQHIYLLKAGSHVGRQCKQPCN